MAEKTENIETRVVSALLPSGDDGCMRVDPAALEEPIKLLQQGFVVAIPTETVYGLAANALDPAAVQKIFTVKGRPSDNPLIVHISDMEMLESLVDNRNGILQDPLIVQVMQKFWPGPLTILLPKSDGVPHIVTAGLDKVAVRMPSHPVARQLISQSKLPLAAPSANISGRPSPTTAAHCLFDLKGKVHCIVDGGSTHFGLESTVIDLSSSPPLILRPGGVTLEQLQELIPDVQVYEKKVHGEELAAKPPTPGLKYKHYSPTAKVILFEESISMEQGIRERLIAELKVQKKVAVIRTHSSHNYSEGELKDKVTQHDLGDEAHPEDVARGLFAALRFLDETGVDIIVVEGIREKNEGLAVMNRIRKASSEIL